MVVARASRGQTSFVQNVVDPDPGARREGPAKLTDNARADCDPKRGQQPGPLLLSISVAFRLVGSKRRWPCWGWIRLVDRIAGISDAVRNLSGRTNAVRPVHDAATLDTALVLRSSWHCPIVTMARTSVRAGSTPVGVTISPPQARIEGRKRGRTIAFHSSCRGVEPR